ncbi:MAG: type VII toxin-antitoxin system HepT family RNase toxin [Gemmatimonadota bacterium]
MVDPRKVRSLLGRLAERSGELSRYAELEPDTYLADREGILASRYLLINVIEDALAVANHVIASEGYRSPGDYADSFRVLEERGLLPDDGADRLSVAAGFRNLVVHEYARIDDRRVHVFLTDGLDDLRAFAAAVYEAFPEL